MLGVAGPHFAGQRNECGSIEEAVKRSEQERCSFEKITDEDLDRARAQFEERAPLRLLGEHVLLIEKGPGRKFGELDSNDSVPLLREMNHVEGLATERDQNAFGAAKKRAVLLEEVVRVPFMKSDLTCLPTFEPKTAIHSEELNR